MAGPGKGCGTAGHFPEHVVDKKQSKGICTYPGSMYSYFRYGCLFYSISKQCCCPGVKHCFLFSLETPLKFCHIDCKTRNHPPRHLCMLCWSGPPRSEGQGQNAGVGPLRGRAGLRVAPGGGQFLSPVDGSDVSSVKRARENKRERFFKPCRELNGPAVPNLHFSLTFK